MGFSHRDFRHGRCFFRCGPAASFVLMDEDVDVVPLDLRMIAVALQRSGRFVDALTHGAGRGKFLEEDGEVEAMTYHVRASHDQHAPCTEHRLQQLDEGIVPCRARTVDRRQGCPDVVRILSVQHGE